MKFRLFEFQERAAAELLQKMDSMRRAYDADGSLSAVSLSAPTGSGKTVICAAAAERLLFGGDGREGDGRASILWLSDSPGLNRQTMKRFQQASEHLGPALEEIGPEFARGRERLDPGRIYFLNRQLLGKGKTLSGEAEGGRSFHDVLDASLGSGIRLWLFIDEAHRGLGSSGEDKGSGEAASRTVYSLVVDGIEGVCRPMPCIVGVSATPGRFEAAMKARTKLGRDLKAGVDVPVSAVRESGLVKDVVGLRMPKSSASRLDMGLEQACACLEHFTKDWSEYCRSAGIPAVVPLLIVQVEDRISAEALGVLRSEILRALPDLDPDAAFANVFGEHTDVETPQGTVPYVKPEEVSDSASIRILFAKDAVSTGWDCPRAEVIWSRRRRVDATYIAQLLGRMIRTPLARRIGTVERLDAVSCFLPNFDPGTVDAVVESFRSGAPAVDPEGIVAQPAGAVWFGEIKARLEAEMVAMTAISSTAPSPAELSSDAPRPKASDASGSAEKTGQESKEASDASREGGEEVFGKGSGLSGGRPSGGTSMDGSSEAAAEETGAAPEKPFVPVRPSEEEAARIDASLARMPDAGGGEIGKAFEEMVSRTVRKEELPPVGALMDCARIVSSDIAPGTGVMAGVRKDFRLELEAEIVRRPEEFGKALEGVRTAVMAVRRIDALTGDSREDAEESATRGRARIEDMFRTASAAFGGAKDAMLECVRIRTLGNMEQGMDEAAAVEEAHVRYAAAASCPEIAGAVNAWAKEETARMLAKHSPGAHAVSERNRAEWDRIEGSVKPYVERNLRISAADARQSTDRERYPKHVVADRDGWAYFSLNETEKAVVRTQLASSRCLAWYRNPPRSGPGSLSIAYEQDGLWKNMQPDFVFFERTADGGVARILAEPHGGWLADGAAKLKGCAAYLEDHPGMFSAALFIAEVPQRGLRYLDLARAEVRKAVAEAPDGPVQALFAGPAARDYETVKDAEG
ncbi:MAG: DEAD/DEAH box helicase family protein [Desulfovibrio sp.]|nr:DEAD/DEAH box helicase family protein [Desulfovibrio sp.]